MKIHLREIPEGQSRLQRREPAETLQLGDWLKALEPVEIQLVIDRRGPEVTLRGGASVVAEMACARCLRQFHSRVEAEIVVLADRRGIDDPRNEEALEEEGFVLYHEGIELDLGPSIGEALILEVPQVVLCRPDCRGLCPRCGEDLNEAECGCDIATRDPRWDQLKRL